MIKLINKNLLSNFRLVLATSIMLAVTLFLFGPMEIIMSSPDEFWFGAGDVLPLVVLCSCLCFLFCLLVCWLCSKRQVVLRIALSVFGSIGLGTYIQGNWTFVDYGTMDGQAIDWSAYKGEGITNSIMWILIVLLVVFIYFVKPKFAQYFGYICWGIVAVELVTLVTLGISMIGKPQRDIYSFSVDGELELSSNKENIIVLLADGFDGIDFLPILEAEPELKTYFDGFTYYEDTCGTSLFSQESAINLLTGNLFEVGPSFADNVKKAYSNSVLYDKLKEYNYETYIYVTNNAMVSPDILDYVENDVNEKTEISSWKDAFSSIYKMVGFRYAPHILKDKFWYSSTDFYELKDTTTYSWSNLNLYNLIKEQGVLTKETENNIYQFLWIQGPHEPVVMDRYCNPLDDSIQMSDERYASGQFEQAIGVVRIYSELITALKDAGIYDNTTIVLTADHGWDMRQNPLLLVKKAGDRGELMVSKAPISMIEDYLPTILYFITGNKEYGTTIYDVEEMVERSRPFLVYDVNNGDRTYNSSETKYYTTGAFTGEYILGTEMTPDDIALHAVSGLSSSENTHVWTNGYSAELLFKIDDTANDLEVAMEYTTYAGEQNVRVLANGNVVCEYVANGVEIKSISIPKEYIANRELRLTLELPDAISPTSRGEGTDARVLALAIKEITLSTKNQ